MTNKWQNNSFRASTVSGSWSFTDPQDSTQQTDTIISGSPTYPSLSIDGIHNYGRSGSTGTSSDASQSNSGSNPLLAGYNTISSAGATFFRELEAGTYDFRGAIGSQIGSTDYLTLFEGTFSALQNGVAPYSNPLTNSPANLAPWVATHAYSQGDGVIVPDFGVWECTVAGTSGSTAPSGGSKDTTTTDGTVTWKHSGRFALLVMSGTNSSAHVIDQNSVNTLCTDWASQTPKTFTLTGRFGTSGVLALKTLGGTMRVRQLSFRLQTPTLTDLLVRDELGLDQGTTPTIYAGQPANYPALHISGVGTLNTTNVSLTGALASYFNVVNISGGIWLAANNTPIPDSLAGSQTLNIIQTDANSNGSPHTTALTCTVVSSQGKPTDESLEAKITTQTWLESKRILDKHADLWNPDYGSITFSTTTDVTDAASYLTALSGVTADNNWHRIRLQNGTYDGSYVSSIRKAFGVDGGLVIEPYPGHDPEFNYAFQDIAVHGLWVRNLKVIGDKSRANNVVTPMFDFSDAGATGISGSGLHNKVIFDNVRFGLGYGTGYTNSSYGNVMKLFQFIQGEQAIIKNCSLDYARSFGTTSGMHLVSITNNFAKRVVEDTFDGDCIFDYDSTTGTTAGFGDNHTYINVENNVNCYEFDFTGYVTYNHPDFFQRRTWGQDMDGWSPNATFSTNQKCFNLHSTPKRVYQCTTGGTTASSGNGPSTTGSGITDGTCVWTYLADYNDEGATVYLRLWNNSLSAACPLADDGSQAVPGPPIGRQVFIDSGGGHLSPIVVTIVNNATATKSSYGYKIISPGTMNAEFNTMVGPWAINSVQPESSLDKQYIRSSVGSDSNTVRSFHNVVQQASSSNNLLAVFDEVIVNFVNGGSDPNTKLVGPFVLSGGVANRYVLTALADDGTADASTFDTRLRSMLRSTSGTAGIYFEPSTSSERSWLLHKRFGPGYLL
jgi:hypothetical protein